MKLHYIKLIILNYFRCILILAVVGKLFFPSTFHAYVLSFFKFWGVNKFLYEQGFSLDIFSLLIYCLIQISECYLVLISFTKVLRFFQGIFILFSIFITITFIAYIYGISGDCGCFGDIVAFENGLDKIYFLVANILLSISYITFLKFSNMRMNLTANT